LNLFQLSNVPVVLCLIVSFYSVNGTQKRAGQEASDMQGSTSGMQRHTLSRDGFDGVSVGTVVYNLQSARCDTLKHDETSRQKQAPHRRVHEDAHAGHEYAGNQRLRLQQEQGAVDREVLIGITK
jgi:hypothetical protein